MNPIAQIENDRDSFIEQNKNFIYNTAYRVCKKPLQWENDDELSIAMIAFDKACDSYRGDRGNFFGYARVIIRNALIDYFRKMTNIPYLTFDNDDAQEYIDNQTSITKYEMEMERRARADEIKQFLIELSDYGLELDDLVTASPSHQDTKNALLNLAFICCRDPFIVQYIHKNKMLPVKQICIMSGFKRKTVERWRRYLLALFIVLSGDEYVYLKSYLNIKVGDDVE